MDDRRRIKKMCWANCNNRYKYDGYKEYDKQKLKKGLEYNEIKNIIESFAQATELWEAPQNKPFLGLVDVSVQTCKWPKQQKGADIPRQETI